MIEESGTATPAQLRSEADALVTQADETNAASPTANTLSISVLVFVLLIVGIMTYLIRAGRKADDVLRALGVPMIIGAAVFLVVTGFSQNQISPVIGLLGTIAGYLLGKTNGSRDRLLPTAGEDRRWRAQRRKSRTG